MTMGEFLELNRALPCKFTNSVLFWLKVFHPIRNKYPYVLSPTYIIKNRRVQACRLCMMFLGEVLLEAITISIIQKARQN